MIKEKKWNVCIIGAGTAGIGAAYALANYNLSDGEKMNVILVEPYPILGGTAVNAWVQTWIEGINPPYLEKILMNMVINRKKYAKVYYLPVLEEEEIYC